MKRKRCKVCKTLFSPWSSLQAVCSAKCAAEFVRLDVGIAYARKAIKADQKLQKRQAKPKSYWAAKAQQANNAYIRVRDESEPCISCGRHHDGQYHAGHYRSVGSAPELRFHPWNIHKQCSACNNHLSGNHIEYRKRLIVKIGVDAVEWLEGKHAPQKYTVDDYQEIKAYYIEQRKLIEAASWQ